MEALIIIIQHLKFFSNIQASSVNNNEEEEMSDESQVNAICSTKCLIKTEKVQMTKKQKRECISQKWSSVK